MNRFSDFLAHHNAVPITAGFLFLISGTALAANPTIQQAVIGGVSTETAGVDNSAFLAANLKDFSANMQIVSATEDAESYTVTYQYRTYAVQDGVWGEVTKDGVLTVAKSVLGSTDLKEYATEQLRQVAESDRAYLENAQVAEIASGPTVKTTSRTYSGLAGMVINMKDAILPPAPLIEEVQTPEPPQVSVPVSPVIPDVATSEQTSVVATSTSEQTPVVIASSTPVESILPVSIASTTETESIATSTSTEEATTTPN